MSDTKSAGEREDFTTRALLTRIEGLRERAEAAESRLAEITRALRGMLGAYEALIDAQGFDHEDGSPEDDTCDCPLAVKCRDAEAAARSLLGTHGGDATGFDCVPCRHCDSGECALDLDVPEAGCSEFSPGTHGGEGER